MASTGRIDRVGWLVVFGVISSGCGFEVSASHEGIDAPPDVPIDAAPTHLWAVATTDRAAGTVLVTHPFDDVVGFGTACTDQVTVPTRALLAHPTLPYVYSAANGFGGIGLGCAAITPSPYTVYGAPRPTQTIGFDAAKAIGFFTIDGSSAIGVYRFTTAATGIPTVSGPANGPGASGALALDATNGELFLGGAGVVWSYPLVGAALDFPAPGSHTIAGGCGAPVAIAISGPRVLVFCSDSPDIQRYTRGPFVSTASTVGIGAVDHVVMLPGDRAIAAHVSPTDLVIVHLGGGNPTWVNGPLVASSVTAMAVSADGKVLVTSRQLDPITSELELWRINGDQITPIGTKLLVDGSVTALAVSVPGT